MTISQGAAATPDRPALLWREASHYLRQAMPAPDPRIAAQLRRLAGIYAELAQRADGGGRAVLFARLAVSGWWHRHTRLAPVRYGRL